MKRKVLILLICGILLLSCSGKTEKKETKEESNSQGE